ncbi:MAG TPA: 4-alpha-glucanotransferase [Ignavibacteria bacterium]
MIDYNYLLHTHTGYKWQKFGARRRAGIAVPLFSIYSERSCGVGDFNDLKLLIDWCSVCGFTILQLLPLNDVGADYAPYSSLSTFALDPMYLSFSLLKDCDVEKFLVEIDEIRKRNKPIFGRVNYRIKQEKINLFRKIFKTLSVNDKPDFLDFIKNNSYWLKDYALFKILKGKKNQQSWEKFIDPFKYRAAESLKKIEAENKNEILFICWLQWQLCEQLKEVKQYASTNGIYIMGDLPFLVSRDSADVWAHQNYFRLDLSSGAPPDMYFASGQKWGMPPYEWSNIANDSFTYIKERLRYAQNFYDMFRIDHFIGLFRVWTSSYNSVLPGSSGGNYLPQEEYLWEEHGRRIIDVMNSSTSMLPCAEDLGTVPECSYRVLHEYGIPGIDFQRYMKSNFHFRSPFEYRLNSCAEISTHDSSSFPNWWQYEAGTIDRRLFEILFNRQSNSKNRLHYIEEILFDLKNSRFGRLKWKGKISNVEHMLSILQPEPGKSNDFSYLYLESYNEKGKFCEFLGNPELKNNSNDMLPYYALQKANQSSSVFSIQLIQEYLCLDADIIKKIGRWSYRINTPGKVSKNNWSVRLPLSLNKLIDNNLSHGIRKMLEESGRL